MWVKVCGTTSLEDARLAVDAGADALGFVFTASPRQVAPSEVRAITMQLPTAIERYGVFVHPSFEQVVATVDEANLSGVQLHATDDPTLAPRLREHYAALQATGRRRLALVRVLHLDPQAATQDVLEEQLAALHPDHAGHVVDAILIDSRTAVAMGGTGLRFDWAEASGSFLRAAPHLRLVVAGGLNPENVAEAIATLRPWGVDVVTGVEAAPGRKDPRKVRAFVERARAAARAMAATPGLA
ncbi:phosphoribosylanthranilate isomerase [Acidipila sp. EB88]|uniref:phosphoribosylanthranilate isomerase n=1 Tax=Acidipila sp. EB88 TaxID=2305226 RepID=UPI000F6040F2|nr:phosphoribosylanthranilate isomerase [Acidipila sp. EB88]RRA48059.1 phosphoribosylanthranilate isomerase [Acidipila sp. EB88]